MSPFELDSLFLPALTIFFVTLSVSFLFTRQPTLSILAAFTKTTIFLAYFGCFFDGTYTFLDDWSYLEGGYRLISQGVRVTNIAENWEILLDVGAGNNFLYYLMNAYALRIFGDGYFAPVALNIILTIAISYFGARLAVIEFGMNGKLSKWFYLFLLLHPDILAWSNVMNGKDTVVLLLHVMLLTAISLYYRGHILASILVALPVSLLMFFLRFYIPLFFAIAITITSLLCQKGDRLKRISVGIIFLAGTSFWLGESWFVHATSAINEHFVNPVYGFFRIVLTPIPFNTETAYEFLNFPALIHWVLIPFVVIGIFRIWKGRTQFSVFFLVYVLSLLSLYSIYAELQGPRHRVQLDYALAVFQFLGLMTALRVLRLRVVKIGGPEKAPV